MRHTLAVRAMPINLYTRHLAERARAEGQPAFEAAVAHRDEAAAELDAVAGEGSAAAVIGGVVRPGPEAPADREIARLAIRLTEAQEAVRDAWAAMHPPDACWTDTYNVHNLFHQLGLSWEEPPVSECYERVLLGAGEPDAGEDGHELVEALVLRGEGLQALIGIIESSPVPSAQRIADDLAAAHGVRGLGELATKAVQVAAAEIVELAGGDPSEVWFAPGVGGPASLDDGLHSPQVWRRYFVAKRQALLAFLRRALEGGHDVVVSY